MRCLMLLTDELACGRRADREQSDQERAQAPWGSEKPLDVARIPPIRDARCAFFTLMQCAETCARRYVQRGGRRRKAANADARCQCPSCRRCTPHAARATSRTSSTLWPLEVLTQTAMGCTVCTVRSALARPAPLAVSCTPTRSHPALAVLPQPRSRTARTAGATPTLFWACEARAKRGRHGSGGAESAPSEPRRGGGGAEAAAACVPWRRDRRLRHASSDMWCA